MIAPQRSSDSVQHCDVGFPGRARLFFVVDALSEEIERSCNAAGVQFGDSGESGIERLTRDKPVCHVLRELVVANEAEYLLLAREIE